VEGGSERRLAEVNVARLRAGLDDPAMVGLVRALDDVNWLAEQSPGFVWRHRPDDGPAAAFGPRKPVEFGQLADAGEVVVTLSVWESFDSLRQFVYRTAHALFMQRRTRWFEPIGGFTTALWWVPVGVEPSVGEALDRLEHLRTHGPTPHAFSLRRELA
jgi:hypothetical protein